MCTVKKCDQAKSGALKLVFEVWGSMIYVYNSW